jgi:hypothetical protein
MVKGANRHYRMHNTLWPPRPEARPQIAQIDRGGTAAKKAARRKGGNRDSGTGNGNLTAGSGIGATGQVLAAAKPSTHAQRKGVCIGRFRDVYLVLRRVAGHVAFGG